MINLRYLRRELQYSGVQAVTFVLCVMLSIATLIALNSFKRDVHRSLLNDAQNLHGGDIILHAHYPFSEELQKGVADLEAAGLAERTSTFEFYSMVRPAGEERTLFAQLKAVERNFPLYGSIRLASGRSFKEVLKPGRAVVAGDVLHRLGVSVGSRLHVGETQLEIADVIDYDPTRPVSLFSLGPRIYISTADLGRLNLLGRGSRSEYEILLKLADPGSAKTVAVKLEKLALPRQERVNTATGSRSQIKRFFDNLLFFLSFISIFTLLLSGIGMQSSLSAMLRRKMATIAITRTLGATYRFLLVHYLGVVLILGFLGCIGGIAAGYGIKYALPLLFEKIVPAGIGFDINPADIVEGLVLGLLVVLLFTYLPLYRISGVKPAAVFRHEPAGNGRKAINYLIYLVSLFFLSALVVRQLDDVRTGLYFVAGCLGLILVIFLITTAVLRVLEKISFPNLAVRQALKSLKRPGNATRPIVVTLASALAVLLTIYLLEGNLFNFFVQSYPKDAPNLFCLDIQPDQEKQFHQIVGRDVPLFPVIRARLMTINGKPIDYERERKRKSDSLAREFNLTYRDSLLDDEIITQGGKLFVPGRAAPGVAEVSVLDTIADIGDIGIGDRLVFNIQGVELDSQVTSIRSRTKSRLYPFFYFVFTKQVLDGAPHTFFTALHVEPTDIPELINRIVLELPNVSTINVADTAVRFAEVIKRLAGIITFFAVFSMLAGCLILVSAVFATRLERVRESVYYKVLGGKSAFVLAILVYENILLGALSSLIAFLCATVGAWSLCRYFFEIPFVMDWSAPLTLLAAAVSAVVGIGLLSSIGVVREKPVNYLRHQNEG